MVNRVVRRENWPPSAMNAPEPAADASNAGAAANQRPHGESAHVHRQRTSVLTAGALGRAGSSVGYAPPDVLEQLTRLAVRDLDRGQVQLPPSSEEFA
jgi:hypothetical protein